METLIGIITSKKGIAVIVIGAIILALFVAWQVQTSSFEKKILDLQKTVDNQESIIVDLTNELSAINFELDSVKKGLRVLEDYAKKEKEILEDGNKTKTDILETVTSSEENKSWWNTPIPDSLLDSLMCE